MRPLLLASLFVAILVLSTVPPVSGIASPVNVLVGFHGSVPADAGAAMARHGGVILRDLSPLPVVLVRVGNGDLFLKSVRAEPAVRFAEKDTPGQLSGHLTGPIAANDPRFTDNSQSYLGAMGIPQAWTRTHGREDVIVAILDTGIEASHNEVRDHLWRNPDDPYGYGFDLWNPILIPGSSDPAPNVPFDYTPDDEHDGRHGTHVAGIASAITGNGAGIAGVAGNTTAMIIRVGKSGPYASTIAQGLVLAVENGAKVAVVSSGFLSNNTAVYEAVQYATLRGLTIVAAAGNEHSPSVLYPAAYGQVIAVGAVYLNGGHAWADARLAGGPQIDVAAVGRDVWSTCRDNRVCWEDLDDPGKTLTSWAAPQVGGIAALLLSCDDDLEPADVRGILTSTAVPVTRVNPPTAQPGPYTGAGLVDASAALAQAGC